jgi:hypothetical protein
MEAAMNGCTCGLTPGLRLSFRRDSAKSRARHQKPVERRQSFDLDDVAEVVADRGRFCLASLTVVLIGSLLAGCLQPHQPAISGSASSEATALHVEPSALDFGEVWITNSLQVVFEVTNPSEVPVEVVGIRKSCVCAGVDPDKVRAARAQSSENHAQHRLGAFGQAKRRPGSPV